MSYSRRQYGGGINSRRIGGNPPVRLPGAAYSSSRRGRGAPSSTNKNNNNNNNPLAIQPRSRTSTHNNSNNNNKTTATKKSSQVRTGGGTHHAHGRHKVPVSKRRGAAAAAVVGTRRTAQSSHHRGTSSRNGTSSTAAPRSSQHRAVNKGSSLQVGQYLVGKTIGQGTFGKVKLGVHVGTGEKVAIKILEKKKIVEVADVERVSREILILKRVGAVHDNVIRLYEVIDTPKAIYLIMEYCSGGELFDFIVKHGKVKEKQACNFFHQILNGVEYLHKCNIVHRDLKPENLLMNRRPEGWNVKVVDFGLSNTDDGGKLLKTACGSPCYAAPEMIAGKKYVGPKADMWSLGVVLFALVCGFLPFEHDNTSELYKKILKGNYKCPKFVSPQIRDLLSKILNTNPKHRYSIAQARKHPWMQMVKVKNIQHASTPPRANGPRALRMPTGGGGPAGNANGITGSGGNQESPNNAGNILANIDQQVLRQCADLGFKPALVVEGLVNKLENQATQAYKLLCSRKKKIAEAQARKTTSATSQMKVASPKKISTKVPAQIPPFKGKKTVVTNTAAAPQPQPLQQPAGEPTGTTSTVSSTNPAFTGVVSVGIAPFPSTTPAPTPASASPVEDFTKAVTTTAAARGGRRVVAAANQDRNILPQQPHRPSALPTKKPAVEKQALQAVSLAPMPDDAAERVDGKDNIANVETAEDTQTTKALKATPVTAATTTTTTTTKIPAVAFGTPRIDAAGNAISVVPSRPPENRGDHPASARITTNHTAAVAVAGAGARPTAPLTARSSPARPTKPANMSSMNNGMEIIKGAFNVAHTSSKPPVELIAEIKRVLQQASVPFSMSKEYQVTCHKQNTRFKVEVSISSSCILLFVVLFDVAAPVVDVKHVPDIW